MHLKKDDSQQGETTLWETKHLKRNIFMNLQNLI